MPVKPKYVKEVGVEIVEKYPEAVGKDFDTNKEIVNTVMDIDSTPIRNRIAGHITRLQVQADYGED
jgi:small subunit ribosomal protein S17e